MDRTHRRRRRRFVALVVGATLGAGVVAVGWSALNWVNADVVKDDVIVALPPEVKNLDGSTDILLVGLDSRTDTRGNPLPKELLDPLNAGSDKGDRNTDTIMLVHIPNDPAKKSVAFSIPRDSYVDIAGGMGKHKINSAYPRGIAADPQNSTTAGRKNLIATVAQLTGVTVDHYAEVNLFGFSEMTKAVGGVDVCLTNDVNDVKSGARFAAGQHNLQGVDALKFVRQRHGLPNGDLDRVKRQQAFLAGMANKVLSTGMLTNLGQLDTLLTAVKNAIVIDQGWDLTSMASQLMDLSSGKIEFRTIPTGRINLSTPSDGSAVEVDPNQVKAFVQGLTAETPPVAPPPNTPPADAGTGKKPPVIEAGVPATPQPPPAPITGGGITCVN